jgi:hypothetical protein
MPRLSQLRRLVRASAVLMLAPSAIATEPSLLENEYVRGAVNPQRGGSVTGMLYKKAIRFPFIAGGKSLALSAVPMTVAPGSGLRTVVLSTSLAALAQWLSFQRTLSTGEAESGVSTRDVLCNDSGRELTVRIGTASRQKTEPWRLTDRSWIGDSSQSLERHVPGAGQDAPRLHISKSPFLWRQVEQYGTGFLYRVQGVQAAVDLTARFPAEEGNPVEVAWRSDALTVPAHGSARIESTVWIDKGGGALDQRNAFRPVLVRSDIAAAGRSGEQLAGFATVVSPVARRVRVVVTQSDGGKAGREVARADVQLVPCKVARVPITCTPSRKAGLAVRTTVLDTAGSTLAEASGYAVIDGAPAGRSQGWETYTSPMPAEHYRGTWEQIGEQMAGNAKRIGGASYVEVRKRNSGRSDADLAFYAKRFPFYAELIAGASKVTGIRPAELTLTSRAAADGAACMDVVFYGPDGPSNAFSKERSNKSSKARAMSKSFPPTARRFTRT